MDKTDSSVRLLVVTNLFYPDRGGGASVFADLCFGLAAKGWKVTVFTTHPYYPEWRRKVTVRPWRLKREVVEGVEIFRHGIYVPSSPSRLLPRVFYELSFAGSLLRSIRRGGEYDAVMVFCPLLGAVMFSAARKWILKEPLWLNVQDIPAEAAAASGISQSDTFDWWAQRLQGWLFNRADVWSTISPVMVDRLAPVRRRNQPLHLCPNWLNESMEACVQKIPSKAGCPVATPLRLLYAGNIGKKQGLQKFCKQLSQQPTPFRLTIHGSGGEANAVSTWVRNSGDARFVFGDFLDELRFVKALRDCDVFVITEKAGSGASFIPSKLIPAIATGTPILAICDEQGPLGREVIENKLGFVVEWSKLSTLASVLDRLSTASTEFAEIQSRCLERTQVYQRDLAIDRMAELVRQVANQSGEKK